MKGIILVLMLVILQSIAVMGDLQFLDIDNDDITSFQVNTDRGEEHERTLRVKNPDNKSVSVTFSNDLNLKDSSGNEIDLTFSPNSFTLSKDETKDVEISARAQTKQEIKKYSGTLTVKDSSDSSNSDTLSLTVEVFPDICDGTVAGNDLRVDIKEPDSSDDFKPGDTIDVEVEVDNGGNTDRDVAVEAFLFTGDFDEEIDDDTASDDEIDAGDDQEFDLELNIDIDEDLDNEDLILAVKAYDDDDEDSQCVIDTESIDLDLEDEEVLFQSVSLSPQTAQCGGTVTATVDVMNIGEDDEVDTFITIENSDLDVRESTERFDLDEIGDSGADAVKRIPFRVPEDAEPGQYTMVLTVHYSGDEDTITSPLTVRCGDEPSREEREREATVTVSEEIRSGLGNVGLTLLSTDFNDNTDTFSLPVRITNEDNVKGQYSIEIANTEDWAEQLTPKALTLMPGQSSTLYFYLKTLEGVEGKQSATINVKSGNEVVVTRTLTADFGEIVEQRSEGESIFTGNVLFIIADIILIVVAIFFIRSFFFKKKI